MHQFDWIATRCDEPEAVRDEVRRFLVSPGPEVNAGELAADRRVLAQGAVVAQDAWSAIHPAEPLLQGAALAARLSRNLKAATLWMRVPRDYWEYRLYVGGREVDRFAQVPELAEPYSENLAAWKGNPPVLASVFGVPELVLAKYLVQWPKEAWQRPAEYGEDTKRFAWGRKAFEEDEFPVSDYWVQCDFARRIGLAYDMPESRGVSIEP